MNAFLIFNGAVGVSVLDSNKGFKTLNGVLYKNFYFQKLIVWESQMDCPTAALAKKRFENP